MATTWKKIGINISGGNVSATVQEVVDGVDGKIYTSAAFNRDRAGVKQLILDDLKVQINADRAREASEVTVGAGVDLANFEAFLNT